VKVGKPFIAEDSFWHKTFDGEDYVLNDVFHYRSTAIDQAQFYNGIVRVGKAPGDLSGLYGIWMLATEC